MANNNPFPNFDGLRSEIAHRFGTKNGEQFDFSRADVGTLRTFLKSEYKSQALKYHPDRANGNAAAYGQVMVGVNVSWNDIEKTDDNQLRQYVSDFVNGNSGNEELMARAMEALDHSDAQRQVLETRLAETQAVLIGLGRGRVYTPDQVVVYEDRVERIHITLGNDRQAIPEIIRREEAKARDYRKRAERGEFTIQAYDVEIRKLRGEVVQERDRANRAEGERNTLTRIYDEREVAAGRLIEDLRGRAGEVEGLQRRVSDLTTKVRAYEQKGPNEDTTELILHDKARETNDSNTWYQLASYILTQQTVRSEIDAGKIQFARYALHKAFEKGREKVIPGILSLGNTLVETEKYSLAEAVFEETAKAQPNSAAVWRALADTIIDEQRRDYKTQCSARASELEQKELQKTHPDLVLKQEAERTNSHSTWYLVATNVATQLAAQEPTDSGRVDFLKYSLFKALEGGKDVQQTAMGLGNTLYSAGKFQLAEAVFDEVRKSDESNLKSWARVADAVESGKDGSSFGRQEWIKYCRYRTTGGK